MKQTAVEWLASELSNHLEMPHKYFIEILEQAKEMEKQQMRDASCPYGGGWEDDDFEYWYNETYKNKKQ